MRLLYLLTSILFTIGLLSAQGIQDGLVFYAPFDASTVNLVEWVKPRNHGASFTTDKFGRPNHAMAFDGNDDYLDYGNLLNLGRQNFSISLWVKTESPGGRMINKGMNSIPWGFCVRSTQLKDSNSYDFTTIDENSPFAESLPLSASPPDDVSGEWQHLVVTRAGAELQLYLNNQLFSTRKIDHAALVDSEAPFTLGAAWLDEEHVQDNCFQGALDEVRVYNRRLNAYDIGLLYANFLTAETAKEQIADEIQLEVVAYPNPTSRILNLEFVAAAPRKLRILDPSGRQIRYQQLTEAQEEIPVSGLPPGTYFVRVEEGNQFVVKRFLKVGPVMP